MRRSLHWTELFFRAAAGLLGRGPFEGLVIGVKYKCMTLLYLSLSDCRPFNVCQNSTSRFDGFDCIPALKSADVLSVATCCSTDFWCSGKHQIRRQS